MALQTDAIESRLEGLKQDDRRIFDSQLRAFRLDNKSKEPAGNPVTKSTRKTAQPTYPVEPIITLLEELSRRIDGLERKDRALGDEIRRQARKDQKRRSIATAGGFVVAGTLVFCWMMKWL